MQAQRADNKMGKGAIIDSICAHFALNLHLLLDNSNHLVTHNCCDLQCKRPFSPTYWPYNHIFLFRMTRWEEKICQWMILGLQAGGWVAFLEDSGLQVYPDSRSHWLPDIVRIWYHFEHIWTKIGYIIF